MRTAARLTHERVSVNASLPAEEEPAVPIRLLNPVLASAGAWCMCASLVMAADFPAKPVRLITPFPPGGSVDLVARLLGADLAKGWGQQVVVDNRAGASGNIGTELAKNAPPDGYALLVNT